MKHYVGLDVSMKNTSICIVDEQGKIVHESTAKNGVEESIARSPPSLDPGVPN